MIGNPNTDRMEDNSDCQIVKNGYSNNDQHGLPFMTGCKCQKGITNVPADFGISRQAKHHQEYKHDSLHDKADHKIIGNT